MKFRQYTLNEAKKSLKSMIEFINKNINLVQDFKLEDLWVDVAKSKFTKDTGFYPTAGRYDWEIKEIGWKIENLNNLNYEDILKNFQEFQKTSADSPQEMKEKKEFDHLLKFVKWGSNDKVTGISSYELNSFIRFLRYIVYGKLDQDLRQANNIVDTLRPTEGSYGGVNDFKNVKFKDIGNITMTRFKNGAFQVKGLNKSQLEHIQKIIEMVKKKW